MDLPDQLRHNAAEALLRMFNTENCLVAKRATLPNMLAAVDAIADYTIALALTRMKKAGPSAYARNLGSAIANQLDEWTNNP